MMLGYRGRHPQGQSRLLSWAKYTNMPFFIEFAEAFLSSKKLVMDMVKGVRHPIWKFIFTLLAFLAAVPYFFIQITVNFFASYALRRVDFNARIEEGEIALANPNAVKPVIAGQYLKAAIKYAEKRPSFWQQFTDRWFIFGLRFPIISGMMEFSYRRLTMALVSVFFAGMIMKLFFPCLGIAMIPLLSQLYGLLGAKTGAFLTHNIAPTWANFLRVFLLNMGISAFSSTRAILHFLKDYRASKDGLSSADIESALQKYDLNTADGKKQLELLRNSGRLYAQVNSHLLLLLEPKFTVTKA